MTFQRIIQVWADRSREQAVAWVWEAPAGTTIEFRQGRTTKQNAAMWVRLGAISAQVLWYGRQLSPDDWKLIFLAGLNQEMRIVPNLNGDGFVDLGRSSSRLSVAEMADLIDLIDAFAAERGVNLGGPPHG